MLFQINFREFPGNSITPPPSYQINPPSSHPLINKKEFLVKATLTNSSERAIKVEENYTFELTNPSISSIEFRFWSNLNLTGKDFTTIKIIQQFKMLSKMEHGILKISLIPHTWTFEDLINPNHKHLHRGKHPLLEYDDFKKEIKVNCLIIDITNFWNAVHEKNPWYLIHNSFWPNAEVSLRVFAHLGGPPLIWYAVIPKHLLFKNNISPHIFYFPADRAETQDIFDESKYGKRDLQYMKRGIKENEFLKDGQILMTYLLPPVSDLEVQRLGPVYRRHGMFVEKFRNVIVTDEVTQRKLGFKDKPQPKNWNIFTGFEKALLGVEKQPKQLLLLPQRPSQSPIKDNFFLAGTDHLINIVNGIMHMLWSNGEKINQDTRINEDLYIDKLILSGFSQSGVDLWESGTENIDKIKAMIAIEPQNVNDNTNKESNKLGNKVIERLLKKRIKFFMIGRHNLIGKHGFKYKPDINDKTLFDAIKFKPKFPEKIFAYPPDPNNNNFIRYRVFRIRDINSDPLMSVLEKASLDITQNKLKPSKDLFDFVFHEEHNKDFTPKPSDGVSRWYSHHFALSGGDNLELPPDHLTKGMYNRQIKYKTFFQECIEEIG